MLDSVGLYSESCQACLDLWSLGGCLLRYQSRMALRVRLHWTIWARLNVMIVLCRIVESRMDDVLERRMMMMLLALAVQAAIRHVHPNLNFRLHSWLLTTVNEFLASKISYNDSNIVEIFSALKIAKLFRQLFCVVENKFQSIFQDCNN